MVNRIVNGDFSGGINNDTDRDPNGWEAIGETNQFQVVADQLLPEYEGWLAFNTNNSPRGSQIRQTIDDVKIGEQITFSFDFKEVGQNFAQNVAISYSIFDDLDNRIVSGVASSTNRSFETPIETITHNFIA